MHVDKIQWWVGGGCVLGESFIVFCTITKIHMIVCCCGDRNCQDAELYDRDVGEKSSEKSKAHFLNCTMAVAYLDDRKLYFAVSGQN